jgi:predicted acetyltransferase
VPSLSAGNERPACSPALPAIESREAAASDVTTARRAVELLTPNAAFCDSYRRLVAEFVDNGEKFVPFVLGFDHADFAGMLARLADCSRGIRLPEGFVPHSTYWLVEDGQVVGVSNIRHALTPSLLREGGHIGYGVRPSARRRGLGHAILAHSLHRARDLGIGDVLVTCARTNLASAKVIVRNGGVLESEGFVPERDEIVQRYWIRPIG